MNNSLLDGHLKTAKIVRLWLISSAFSDARRSHSKLVSSVTPRAKLMALNSTLHSSNLSMIITFSSDVRRS
jgi:hypothetical protein